MRRALGSALLVAAVAVRVTAHDPITTKVTWSREIAPIVSGNCAGCHRPGGPAPMSLASYADARPWAKAMRAEVVAGRMPRWAPVRGFGHFLNDRSLSPFEAALVAAWADGGAPEGDEDRPAADWMPAGRFDARIVLERRVADPAGGRQTFDVAVGNSADMWVTGWRFFANDPAIVQAEFSLAGGAYLGNWVPPEGHGRLPGESAMRLPARARLSIAVWHRTAQLQQDFPVGPPSLPPVLALTTVGTPPRLTVETLTRPCGESRLDVEGRIFAVRPTSARTGDGLAVALVPPDAPPVPLVRIRDFDPTHLETYRLRDAAAVSPGSRLLVDGSEGCQVQVQIVRNGV